MPRLAIVLLIALIAIAFAGYHPQTGSAGGPGCTIKVDSALDNIDTDTVVTLREAIFFSMNEPYGVGPDEMDEITGNVGECDPANPGPNIDEIVFDEAVFPDGGLTFIFLASTLPLLNQHGGGISGNGDIIITGVNKTFDCLTINSNFHSVTGLQFSNCDVAVTIDGSARPAENNAAGSGNAERNYFYGNQTAIVIGGSGATNNRLENNYIGTTLDGTADVPNVTGVQITDGAHGNRVGGLTSNGRNVISGNNSEGVLLDGNSTTTEIVGNYIGVNAAGTGAIGNSVGVSMFDSAGNTIGSTSNRNIISGNYFSGIELFADMTFSNSILGNYIGTDASGKFDVGNGSAGVFISNSANNNIGGSAPGEGNLISGNNVGIQLSVPGATDNVIFGNTIGLGSDGSPIGNTQWGIADQAGSGGNTIGGNSEGQGNEIAYNGADGVGILVDTPFSHGEAIRGNSIHHNGGLGIDLDNNDVTENDADDSDDGGNGLQNFPELDSVELAAGQLHVIGGLTSAPLTNYHIEFFANHDCDPSGNDEGEQFIGSIERMSDASATVLFDVVLPTSAVFGDTVTATATDPDGNTSEFSDCHPITLPPGDIWGDNDCNSALEARDALGALYLLADLPLLDVGPECPVLGEVYISDSYPLVWGDVQCWGSLTIGDVIGLLAYIAGKGLPPVSTPCPGNRDNREVRLAG